MVNLDYSGEKSIKEDFTIVQQAEDLDKPSNVSEPKGDISPVLLVLFGVVNMAILIIMFSL